MLVFQGDLKRVALRATDLKQRDVSILQTDSMMHSPFSNCLLRPRSSHHRHRRSCSSPSSLIALPPSPSSADELDNHHASLSSPPRTLQRPTAAPSHRPSFESRFPSPFSLNVPLGTGSYLCTLTLSNRAASLSLCGDLIYAGLHCGDILVLKTPKLPDCARFGIGNVAVKALLVTDDTIFSAHSDHKIRVWRRPVAPGVQYKLLRTLPTTADYLRNLVIKKSYVQIRRHHTRLWIEHVDTISAMALGGAHDGNNTVLYSASWDKTFKVWSLRTMRCIQSVKAHHDAINAILVTSQDGFIYTASADNTIKVWKKLHKLVQVATVDGAHMSSVNALAMRPDAGILYSAGSDCSVNVWQNSKEGGKFALKLTTSLRGHRLPVFCLAVSGPVMCSGSADKMIRVWRRGSVGSYTCLAILQGHNGPIKSIAISISSLRSGFVYSTSLDSTTKVWSVIFDKDDSSAEYAQLWGI